MMCRNCTNGNHSGTNGTSGCCAKRCSCPCRKRREAEAREQERLDRQIVADRIEQIRRSIRDESVSWSQLADLDALADHIDPDDVELLEWAGVPESTEGGIVTTLPRSRRGRKPIYEHDADQLLVACQCGRSLKFWPRTDVLDCACDWSCGHPSCRVTKFTGNRP